MNTASAVIVVLVAAIGQVRGQCGGTYTNLYTDTVYHWSPNYPYNYPNNARCDMIFEHNSTGAYGWEFNTVGYFNIDGPVGNICYDYVRIVETVNGRESVLGVFCGTNGPRYLRSQTSKVTVQFRSDGSGQRQGFNISATPYGLCGGQFNLAASNSLRFVSPNHPQLYPNNALCTYTITAPPNRNISFMAEYFNLEQSLNCNFDYLRFNETVRGWGVEMGRFCGTNGPYWLKSSSNRVTATFRSDATGQSYGFKVVAYSVLGRANGSLRAKEPIRLESRAPQYRAIAQKVPSTYQHIAVKLRS
ncbi:hypothetical protein RvY_16795-2 [Ramazzottius varieornatus]|nr:hypothetical protein RvY_16795-2 [Ramazzottius varieornatus]